MCIADYSAGKSRMLKAKLTQALCLYIAQQLLTGAVLLYRAQVCAHGELSSESTELFRFIGQSS